jgi:WD40 repeat protein
VTSQLCPHRGGLFRAVISRNNRWLLSQDYKDKGNSLYLTDLATRERVRTFTFPTYDLYSCAIADNHSFVAGGGSKDIYVWNTNSKKLVATLTGHTDSVRTCSIFFNDTRIASGSYDWTVRVWQVKNFQWKSLHVLKGRRYWIASIFTLADNPWIISFANDKTLRVWNSDTGKCLEILTGHTERPSYCGNSCVMSLDHQLVGSIDRMGTETKLWNITTGTCTLTIPNISGSGGWYHHIVYLSSQRLVWWQSDWQCNQVCVWNLLANKKVYILSLKVKIKLVNVSADGKYLIIVLNKYNTEYAFVQVYNFETGTLIESKEQKSIND